MFSRVNHAKPDVKKLEQTNKKKEKKKKKEKQSHENAHARA